MSSETTSSTDGNSATESESSKDFSEKEVDQYFESGGKDEPQQAPDKSDKVEEEIEESDDSEDKAESKQSDKKVPYGALHEERERRKVLQKQVSEIERKNARLEETFQQMMLRMQQPQQQYSEQQTSYDEDPLGTLKAKTENLERYLTQQVQYQQQQQQVETAQHQFIDRYQKSAQAFMQDKPDFKDAYTHLVHSRLEEFGQAGYNADQAKQLLHEDEAAIVAKAYLDGVNPAERMYNLARNRGFKGGALQGDNNQKLEQMEKGVQASRSLSNTAGKSKQTLRLEDIAELSDAEFEKVDWKKMMGAS